MQILKLNHLIVALVAVWANPVAATAQTTGSAPAPPAPPMAEDAGAVLPLESANHPLRAETHAIRASLEEFLGQKKYKFKTYQSKNGRLRLHSDYRSSRDPKKALKDSEKLLATFNWALGEYVVPDKVQWHRDDLGMEVLMIMEEEVYHALIDTLSEVSPRLKPFLQSSKNVTGFTLYPAKLTVTYNDVKIQAEARIERSVAHSLAHLEMHRRYGFIPLWLAEGVACAMEELTFEEIWANWYRDGFVYASSHSGWRGPSTGLPIQKLDLQDLWSYSAKPYQDELAHLSYGFAIYMLEAKPKQFDQFCLEIQKRYDKHPELGGQYKLLSAEAASIAMDVFGAALQADLRAYWKKTPKRPNLKKKPTP